MKYFCHLFFLLLMTTPFSSAAQTSEAALREKLSKLEPDTLTLEQYLARAADMGGDDITSAKIICNWVYETAVKKNLEEVQAHALYGMGRAYLITDDYTEATGYFNRALEIAIKRKMLTTQASVYGAFGNIYSSNKQIEEAKKNYIRAIEIHRSTGDKYITALNCYNLAAMLIESPDDSVEGIGYLNQALALCSDTENYEIYLSAMGLKAYLYSYAGKFDSVPYFLSEAQKLIEKNNIDEYKTQIYFYRGAYELNLKQYDKAIATFKTGLAVSREQNSMEMVYNFYDLLSTACAGKGDYKQALKYYTRHKEVYDSVINANNFNKVLDLRHLYENEKKEKEMLETRKAKAITDLRLEAETRKKNNLIFLIGGLVLVAFLFLFLIVRLRNNIRERKQAYIKLEEKNIEIQEQSEKLVKQSREIARYQSQMNPHFVFNALNSIQGHVMNDEKNKTITQLQFFSKLMRQTLNNSDNELISLSTEFDFLKLYFAFEKERFQKEIQFEISSDTDNENVLIPPMLIQPFIENALKHAGLDHVDSPKIRLRIQEQGELLMITVSDNGSGMKTETSLRNNKPHATEIARSRIRLLFEDRKQNLPAALIEMLPATEFTSGTELHLTLPLINRF